MIQAMQNVSRDHLCGAHNEGPQVFTTTFAIYQTKFQHKSFIKYTTWSPQQYHRDPFCLIFAGQAAKACLSAEGKPGSF